MNEMNHIRHCLELKADPNGQAPLTVQEARNLVQELDRHVEEVQELRGVISKIGNVLKEVGSPL